MQNKHHIIALALGLGIAFARPVAAQVEPGAEGGSDPEEGTKMMTPPPVNGMLYPSVATADERANYLASSLILDAGYLDNVLPGANAPLVSDSIFSVIPNISLNRTSAHQQMVAEYNPDFVFYEPTSELNTVDQSASAVYQGHPSPYVTISLQDCFSRTSNVFDVNYPFAEGGLTGSIQSPGAAAVAPFAEQLNNTANGGFAYQFGRNAMIGAGGTYSIFDFPNPADALGLGNSHGGGGSAFYDRRIAAMQYVGISYEYDRTLAGPSLAEVDGKVQTILPFYTLYLNRRFSASVSGGIQHATVEQPAQPASTSWQPSGVISMGWQGNKGTAAVSYLHAITSGRGLDAPYNSNSLNGMGTWNFAYKWKAKVDATYTTLSIVTPLTGLPYQNGNTFGVGGSLIYGFNDHFTIEGGYERLHQNFAGIAVIFKNPDSDREFVTFSYHFDKPLGR